MTHALNPCGLVCAPSVAAAFTRALAADPVAAFGGGLACNRPLDEEAALALLQPGGSGRDAESIATGDELGLAMGFTGRRHFWH